MNITTQDTKVTSYIVGLHFFRKDHNYGLFKGDFLNDMQSLFNTDLASIKIGNIDIVKNPDINDFELRLSPENIVFQHNVPFDEMLLLTEKILVAWQTHSKNSKVKLAGLVFNFSINSPKPNETNRLNITSQYFKDLGFWCKIKGANFRLNFLTDFNNNEYNINFSLLEGLEAEYSYKGSLDINRRSDNPLIGLLKEEREKIFADAKNYFQTAFVDILNYKG